MGQHFERERQKHFRYQHMQFCLIIMSTIIIVLECYLCVNPNQACFVNKTPYYSLYE